jgi:protein-S-isoprenylcysteine O-methyltransferase Ste14
MKGVPSMLKRKSWRVPIGFFAAIWFIWVADPTPVSLVIGAIIMALGETIRFLSAGTLRKFKGVTRTGMYAYTRNPLYIGSFLIGLGASITGRDALFAIVFLAVFIILYTRVVFREEKYLVGRYGDDYVKYLDEVPRFIPHTINIAEVLRGSSLSQAYHNRERQAIMGVLGIWAVMIAKMIWF